MNKSIKKWLVLLLVVVVAFTALTLVACDGLFGENGPFGNGGGNNGNEKLTAEYDATRKVYVGDSLDKVKQYITVSYTDKDGYKNSVSDFELTGTLAEGKCTLTVRYEGLTTTVTVTVLVNTNPLNLGFKLSADGDSYALTALPESVTELVIPSTYDGKAVTSIASDAFRYISSLTSITIPASVTQIDSMCSKVESVYYDGTVADWCNITCKKSSAPLRSASNFYIKNSDSGKYEKLTQVVIPDGVTVIPDYAFYGLKDITSVSISNSVINIGESAFESCENISSLTIGNKVETIGYKAFYQCAGLTSLTIPDSVTEIGDYSFYNCRGLTSLELGKKLTSIGVYAFVDCAGLDTIEFPDSLVSILVNAFYNCTALTSITIGNGVKEIFEGAFSACTSLESVYYNGTIADWCGIAFQKYSGGNIRNPMYYASEFFYLQDDNDSEYTLLTDLVIPDGVKTIGDCQFYGFGELNSIIIPNSVTSVSANSFGDCTFKTSATIPGVAIKYVTAPTMVITNGTTIDVEAFKNRKTITSITLPSSLTSISRNAFDGCTGLTSIEISENVTYIGEDAFKGCTGLTSIEIPQSVKTIDTRAFYSCRLQSITLHKGLETIGGGVFDACTNNIDVYFNGTLADWCNITLNSTPLAPRDKYSPTGKFYIRDTEEDEYTELTEIVIPSTVKKIGKSQFSNFEYVTSIVIHDGVTSIGGGAFASCKGITSLIIPEGVKDIGESAFNGCSNLEDIYVPNSVESIGKTAFSGINPSAFTIETVSAGTVRYIGNENNPHLVLESVPYNVNNRSFVINENTKIIMDSSFEKTVNITNITIPVSVKYIGQYAFPTYLDTIYYDGTLEDWCDITIGSTIFDTWIKMSHFYIKVGSNYTEVTELVIPEGVTSIGNYQFARFYNINSVSLPQSLTYIGEYAFSECKSITNVDMYDNVTEIAKYAFQKCSALANVTMSDGVHTIGDSAFSGCSELESMQAPKSLVNFGENVFKDCNQNFFTVYDNASYWGNENNPHWILIKGANNTTKIHEDTKVIASRAFGGTTITSIVIPDSVESIGEYAFNSCKYLTSVTIGSGVTYIGYNAFYMSEKITNLYYNGTIADWCNIELNDRIFRSPNTTNRFYLRNSDGDGYTEVTELVIPDGVVSIDAERFYVFNNIITIRIGKDVTSLGRYAFGFCSKVFYVYYEGTIEEWKAIEKDSWIYDMMTSTVICSDGNTSIY